VKQEGERRQIFLRYLGEVASAVHDINGVDKKSLYEELLAVAKKKTSEADARFDKQGERIEEGDELDNDPNSLIVREEGEPAESAQTPAAQTPAEPAPKKKKK
jgi:DNA topoisomerase-6 subunit B